MTPLQQANCRRCRHTVLCRAISATEAIIIIERQWLPVVADSIVCEMLNAQFGSISGNCTLHQDCSVTLKANFPWCALIIHRFIAWHRHSQAHMWHHLRPRGEFELPVAASVGGGHEGMSNGQSGMQCLADILLLYWTSLFTWLSARGAHLRQQNSAVQPTSLANEVLAVSVVLCSCCSSALSLDRRSYN